MDNSVNFQINVAGNGNIALMQINNTANKTIGNFEKLSRLAVSWANIGFVFQHVGSVISAVNNTITKYTNAYEAQAVAETKLAAVMRQTIGAGSEEVESMNDTNVKYKE